MYMHVSLIPIIYGFIVRMQAIISYFEEQGWISSSSQVFKRQVTFVEPSNDATAEICVMDESADGKIINFHQDCKVWY